MTKKLLVFSGSTREGSVNMKLAQVATKKAKELGAEAELINLNDFDIPLYNGDIEAAGFPADVTKLKGIMKEADGFIFASPEYNGHVPPVLVNMFAWTSRPEEGETMVPATVGKKAAVMGASPGGLGGVRMIPRLRDMLSELSLIVVPGFATVPSAFQAFGDDGTLLNEATEKTVTDLVARLINSL